MNKKRIPITLLFLAVSMMMAAQYMTYNHDPVVMNQFMKGEIGSWPTILPITSLPAGR